MPELVAGIGLRPGTSAAEVMVAVQAVLALVTDAVIIGLATVDRRASEPAVVVTASELGIPVLAYSGADLAEITVPHPAPLTEIVLGTPSVAEAAAVRATDGGTLVVPKQKVGRVTIAAAADPGRRLEACAEYVSRRGSARPPACG